MSFLTRVKPRRVAAVALGIVVALGFGEVVARIAGLGDTTLTRGRLHQYHEEAGWTCAAGVDARYMQPGSFDVRVVCNERGLRDRSRPLEKPAGVRRIAVFGDSMMWGYGVENDETFSAVLERSLPDTEVVNFGVNGYSTIQELVRLETEGVLYVPDIVLVAFTWNDLDDNLDDKDGGRPYGEVSEDGELRVLNRPVRARWKSPVKQSLRRHSRLFAFAEYCGALIKASLQKSRDRGGGDRDRSGGDDAGAGPEESAPLLRKSTGATPILPADVFRKGSTAADPGWRVLRATLGRMRDVAASHGARLVVVDNATRTAVLEKAAPRRIGLERDEFDRDAAERRLAGICADLDVVFVPLARAFRDEKDRAALFLPRNGHWSVAGTKVAARTAAARLRELLDD